MTNTTTSHTYTVGRSEGVIYPPDFPTAPTVPQLAALYDKAAQRIAQLESALRNARSRCLLLARERNALKSQISNLP